MGDRPHILLTRGELGRWHWGSRNPDKGDWVYDDHMARLALRIGLICLRTWLPPLRGVLLPRTLGRGGDGAGADTAAISEGLPWVASKIL